jgi:hypothetical protein
VVPVWTLLAVVLLAVLVLYLRGLAGRLDRLHLRVEASREALEAQLVRRAGAALELASSGAMDVASAFLLAEAATAALDEEGPEREAAESALSADLRAVLDAPGAAEALIEDPAGAEQLRLVGHACERVALARRFHNDAVRSTRELRDNRVVRLFHLAGHAELPQSFEIDDAPPAALSRAPGRST